MYYSLCTKYESGKWSGRGDASDVLPVIIRLVSCTTPTPKCYTYLPTAMSLMYIYIVLKCYKYCLCHHLPPENESDTGNHFEFVRCISKRQYEPLQSLSIQKHFKTTCAASSYLRTLFLPALQTYALLSLPQHVTHHKIHKYTSPNARKQ
jgi:hypothetical protein